LIEKHGKELDKMKKEETKLNEVINWMQNQGLESLEKVELLVDSL
jgi:cell division protein FtsB